LNKQKQNFRVQQFIVFTALSLFILKVLAWWLTKSVAILTDTLESTVNVIAGFIGLYSLYIAAKPRDEDHPYGHGKAEFVSAAVEGTLIFIAGLIIIYTSAENFIHPKKLEKLDDGIVLVEKQFTGAGGQRQAPANRYLDNHWNRHWLTADYFYRVHLAGWCSGRCFLFFYIIYRL